MDSFLGAGHCSTSPDCRILVDGEGFLEIISDHLIGWVVGGQGESGDYCWVGGWAADRRNRNLAKAIVAFQDDRLLAQGRTRFDRPNAVRMLDAPHLGRSGFRLEFVFPPGQDPAQARIRVFAISEDGKASELHYPENPERWPFQPNRP